MKDRKSKRILLDYKVTIVSVMMLLFFNFGFIFKNTSFNWSSAFCSLMEFNRSLIFRGDIWRLFTCHLVHWSPEHFCLDMLVFVILGFTFEKRIGTRYGKVLVVSGLSISMVLLAFQHDLYRYRGISGLINAQFILGMGLFILDCRHKARISGFYGILFSVHLFKIAYETIFQSSLFDTEALGNIGQFTPLSHLVGAIMGLFYLMSILKNENEQRIQVAKKSGSKAEKSLGSKRIYI